MSHIGWSDAVGYVASLLVFCTFYMRTMLPLRVVAIASNVAFITYGCWLPSIRCLSFT